MKGTLQRVLPRKMGASRGRGSGGGDPAGETNVFLLARAGRTCGDLGGQECPRPQPSARESHAKSLNLCIPGCGAGPAECQAPGLPLTSCGLWAPASQALLCQGTPGSQPSHQPPQGGPPPLPPGRRPSLGQEGTRALALRSRPAHRPLPCPSESRAASNRAASCDLGQWASGAPSIEQISPPCEGAKKTPGILDLPRPLPTHRQEKEEVRLPPFPSSFPGTQPPQLRHRVPGPQPSPGVTEQAQPPHLLSLGSSSEAQ